jgi:hypothetical protein
MKSSTKTQRKTTENQAIPLPNGAETIKKKEVATLSRRSLS